MNVSFLRGYLDIFCQKNMLEFLRGLLKRFFELNKAITNGLDEDICLIEQMRDRAFLNENNSLVFIFSKFGKY